MSLIPAKMESLKDKHAALIAPEAEVVAPKKKKDVAPEVVAPPESDLTTT